MREPRESSRFRACCHLAGQGSPPGRGRTLALQSSRSAPCPRRTAVFYNHPPAGGRELRNASGLQAPAPSPPQLPPAHSCVSTPQTPKRQGHNLLVQMVPTCICLYLRLGMSPSRKFKPTPTRSLSPEGCKYFLPDHKETTEASYKHRVCLKDDEMTLFCTDPDKTCCPSPLPKYRIRAVSRSCRAPLRRSLTFIDSPSSCRRKFGTQLSCELVSSSRESN